MVPQPTQFAFEFKTGDPPAPQKAFALNYLADIDGLRGVAVLLVVLYHARIPGFSGGFIGVDVFFVISGFLISRILFHQLSAGEFSFQDFYFRRSRRIFPVLFCVLLTTALVSFWLVPPNDLISFARSLTWSSLFLANHYFLGMTHDYWEQTRISSQPLLHTWSLGIEEQFYLLFPLLLFIAWNRRPALILGFTSLLSFVACLFLPPAQAFYLMPARFWELALGAGLCLAREYRPLGEANRALSRGLGLALIGAALAFCGHGVPHPGYLTLLPTLGAALIILAAGEQASLMGSRVPRTIGLASFSLYLWHWPVMVFAQSPILYYSLGTSAPLAAQLPLIAGLSYLSWRFVEVRFRRPETSPHAKKKFLVKWSLALALLSAFGLFLHKVAMTGSPVKQPIPEAIRRMMPSPGERAFRKWQSPEVGAKNLGAPNVDPTFALAGDSFASMWGPGLDALARAKGKAGILIAREGCPLLLDHPVANDVPACAAAAVEARVQILKNSPIEKVILAVHWEESPGYEAALEKTIAALKGKHLFLLLPTPKANWNPYVHAIESLRNPSRLEFFKTAEAQAQDPDRIQLDKALARLAKTRAFTLLRPSDVLCEMRGCLVARDGLPLYEDFVHLNDLGSQIGAAVFSPALE